MLRIFNDTKSVLLFVTLVAGLSLLPAHFTKAETAEELRAEQIDLLLMQIDNLVKMVKDREEFNLNKNSLKTVDLSDRSKDFFLRMAEDSPEVIFGKNKKEVFIETDGGVTQIVATVNCTENGDFRLFSNSDCAKESWLIKSEENNGIKTFSIPVSFVTKDLESEATLSLYACRYDGCVYEQDLGLEYKAEVSFSDEVEIYDRYEWTYDWNDKTHHVQEVLLNFPFDNIKEIKLTVSCDNTDLYIKTTEDERATCTNRRVYSRPDYKTYHEDELNNVYNLRIESVTNDIQVEDSGKVEMEFKFIDKQNKSYTFYHRPVQKDEITEEDEDVEQVFTE